MISHMTMTSRLMMFDRPLALAYLQIFDAKNSTQLTSSRSRFSFFIYAIRQARIYSFLIRSLQVLSLAVIGNLMKEAEREREEGPEQNAWLMSPVRYRLADGYASVPMKRMKKQ